MSNWYPDASDAQAIRKAFDFIYELLGRQQALEKLNPIGVEQAAARFGPEVMRGQLEAGGAAPLNIQGLIGQASQSQLAFVPNTGISLPDVVADPLSQDRQLILRNGQFYVFDGSSQPGTWSAAGLSTLIDTHAHRLDATNFPQYQAANLAPGTLFFETDRTVFYIVKVIANVNTWIYAAGEMTSASTTIADIPLDLGANDVGFIYNSSFWFHRWMFINSGPTGYTFAPGDPGAGYIVASTGTPPSGGKWGLCNGTAYSFIDKNAQAASVTSPHLETGAFVRGGPYNGPGTTAAARTTWEAGAITDDESAHTHVVNLGGNNSYMPGPPNIVASPGGTTTSAPGSAHHHTLSDANAQLKVPNDANGGQPLNIKLDWYVRL